MWNAVGTGMRRTPVLHVALLCAACTGKTAVTPEGPSDAATDCAFQASPYNAAGNCLEPKVTTAGLCVRDKITKSLYDVCLEGPDARVYRGFVSSGTATFSGDGWRVGPASLADFFHAPRLSDDAEATCAKIQSTHPAACAAASSDAGTPPATSARVGATPDDLTTSTGTSELSVFADNGLNAVDSALLEAVAAKVELRTYPELSPVAFTTMMRGPQAGPEPTRSSIVVTPNVPLEDRWYVLSVSALPSGSVEAFANTALHHTAALGVVVSRFRPGSAPVLRGVSLCQKSAASRIVVDFSEGVTMETLATRLHAGDGSCTLVSETGVAAVQPQIFFDCSASMATANRIHVTMQSGITSATGVVAGILDPNAATNDTVVTTSAVDEDITFQGSLSSGCIDWVP